MVDTVDGSEIRRSPVELGTVVSPIIYREFYILGGYIAGFLPSTVCIRIKLAGRRDRVKGNS